MQVVSVGVATLVALMLLYSGTNSAVVPDAALITAEAPKAVPHHTQFDYLPVQQVREVVPAPQAVQKVVAPKVEFVPTVVPVQEVLQETAVSACLGKFAGSACTFDAQDGTCIALSWSPLTCVPH